MDENTGRSQVAGIGFGISTLIFSVVIAIVISIALRFLSSSKTPKLLLPTFLLVGPRDVGKTSFLLYLRDGNVAVTQTSAVSSTAEVYQGEIENDIIGGDGTGRHFTGAKSRFHLIDTPGHPKLRSQALKHIHESNLNLTGLIFILDSAALSSQARLNDTAEYLYNLLLVLQSTYAGRSTSSNGFATTSIPFLIACNKSDLFTALPPGKISSLLQNELGRLRESKRRGLLDASADGDDVSTEYKELGDENVSDISWDLLRDSGLDVRIESGSIKAGLIEPWTHWIADVLANT